MNPSRKIFWQKCVDFACSRRFLFVLIGIGLLLRLKYYSGNLSLWIDEAALVLEIIRRPAHDIFFGLHYNPSSPTAPVGFLVMEKAAIGIFGNNEFVLRFIPLAASIASIFLFSILVKRRCRGAAALIALAAFVFAGPLIYYSVQVKHYALDVLAAVLSFLAADYIRATRLNLWRALVLGIIGAVAVWFSYGAIFVWAGIFPTLILFRLLRRQFGAAAMSGLAACFVMVNLYGLYVNDFSQIGRNSQVHAMWEKAFMPWPIGSWASLVWLQEAFLNMFRETLGLSLAPLAAGLFIFGAIVVFRKDREAAILLLSPLAIALGAAMAHKYPFSGRLILFLAPSLIILLAEGMAAAAAKFPKYSTAISGLLAASVLFSPLRNAVDVLGRSHAFEEMRPIMSYLKEHYQGQDAVYLNNSAQYAYGYYSGYYGLHIQTPFTGVLVEPLEAVQGFNFTTRGAVYINFARNGQGYLVGWQALLKFNAAEKENWEKIRYNKKTWLIFSHATEGYRGTVLNYFNREGKKLEEFHAPGASIYLFDMEKP